MSRQQRKLLGAFAILAGLAVAIAGTDLDFASYSPYEMRVAIGSATILAGIFLIQAGVRTWRQPSTFSRS